LNGGRGALVIALVGVAGLALFVLYEHYGRADRERAVVAVRTARFDGTTRARVGTFLKARRPGASLTWSAKSVGPFSDEVDVTLKIGSASPPATYRFRVRVPTRDVTPRDEATSKFIDRIKRGAGE